MSAADTFVPRRGSARGADDTAPRRSAESNVRQSNLREPGARQAKGREAPQRQRGLLYTGLTTAIALAVVAGAGYFAWTVYAGDGVAVAGDDETIPVIVAALEEHKSAPEDPGGITAPGGDFGFYSEMDGRPLEVRPGEERVLPPPESPIDELLPELFDRPAPAVVPADESARTDETSDGPGVPAAAAAAGVTVPPVLDNPMLPLPTIDETQITPEPVALSTSTPAADETVAEPAARPASSSTVQLASMRSSQAADEEVRRLRRILPDLLAERAPIIRESVSNGTTYFRVSFSTNGPIDAAALCSEIKSRDLDCIVHN